jgi:hypothetical protein
MLLIAFTLIGGLAFLILMGRSDETATLRDWEIALTPDGQAVLARVAQHVRHERGMAEESYARAVEARQEGSLEEAVRYLRTGSRVVETCSDTLPALLKNLAVLSWQAAAILPSRPLRPLQFHVGQFRTLAGLHTVGHHLLATTRERFRLRIAVLRYGLRAAAGMLIRNTRALIARPDTISEWDRVAMIRADIGTLTDESLESLRVLLASLAAVRREPGRRPASQESRG